MTRLREDGAVTENGITLTWSAGQASALDTSDIGEGRDVGTIRVHDAQGRDLAHDVMFAFAFHAFWPMGDWMLGRSAQPRTETNKASQSNATPFLILVSDSLASRFSLWRSSCWCFACVQWIVLTLD